MNNSEASYRRLSITITVEDYASAPELRLESLEELRLRHASAPELLLESLEELRLC